MTDDPRDADIEDLDADEEAEDVKGGSLNFSKIEFSSSSLANKQNLRFGDGSVMPGGFK